MRDSITLIDQTTGRAARCAVRFHSQAAAEIEFDDFAEWSRKVRRVRFVRRCLSAALPAVAAGLYLATPSGFACGLYVSDEEGTPRAWVVDGIDD